jgi:hypothetical protein
MTKKTISPRKIVKVNGILSYDEALQAWSILRLRKDLINEFNQLKEKRSKFSYELLFYRSYEEFEKAMKDLVKKEEVLPILMFLKKEIRE